MSVEELQADQSTQDNTAFSAGFSDDISPAAPRNTDALVVEQESAPIEPVRIMPDDWAAMNERVAGIDALKADLQREQSKVFGKVGEMNRLIQQMQQANQQRTGDSQLTAANMRRLTEAGYGDLAEMLAEDLRGMPIGSQIDPSMIDARWQEKFAPQLEQIEQRHEKKLLRIQHRDWESVVQSAPFNEWKATLPPGQREQLDNTWDSEVIASYLDAFKARQTAAAPAQAKQKPSVAKRLEAAITPQGSPNQGKPALTEADAFRAGFNDD